MELPDSPVNRSRFPDTSVQNSLETEISSAERNRLYKVWRNLRSQARDTGIFIDWQWRGCFDIFLAAALASGARKGLSIELIDPEAGYVPGNVRWVTRTAPARRDNRIVDAFGRSLIPARWAEDDRAGPGVTATTIHARLRLGWSPEDAITTPVRAYRPRVAKVSA